MKDVKIDRVYLLPVTMDIDRVAIAEFVAVVKMDFERYAAELDLVEELEPIRFVANIWRKKKLNTWKRWTRTFQNRNKPVAIEMAAGYRVAIQLPFDGSFDE